jgi:L-seryl-tRNA(Ser) seleniumtransferase
MTGPEGLRALPQVDRVLQHARLVPALDSLPREIVTRVVQEELECRRAAVRAGSARLDERDAVLDQVARDAAMRLATLVAPSLRRVINATGVVLHTNLGRAPLSEAAVEALTLAARGYANLEYDLQRGERTSRMEHLAERVAMLCGAEAATVVNNNAAAVLLAVDTLGQAGVVVSRGELVEIGDSFRLPDILARSRVPIHEVGTTNRTTPADYEAAATVPGCVLLKVHRSNFTVHGFTREAGVAELAQVAARCGATVVYDLGSGCLADLEELGLPGEPDVRTALREGADVVTMSGDKLLGGPQAGIVAGRREAIAAMRRNPLGRALRIDKLTLAALQATLLSYLSRDGAQREVPTLRLILTKLTDIEARARRLLARLEGCVRAELELAPSRASVGGGSFADLELPSFEVRLRAQHPRATELLRRLRTGDPAVVARIKDEWVGLDLRCVAEDEVEPLALAVERALGGRGEPR